MIIRLVFIRSLLLLLLLPRLFAAFLLPLRNLRMIMRSIRMILNFLKLVNGMIILVTSIVFRLKLVIRMSRMVFQLLMFLMAKLLTLFLFNPELAQAGSFLL